MEQFIRTKTGVNFRTGPGTSNSVLKYLPAGTELQIIADAEGTWYYAKELTGNALGYVTSLTQYVVFFKPTWLQQAEKVIAWIEDKMYNGNRPYVYGSTRFEESSFDCSDLMQHSFRDAAGVVLSSNTRDQTRNGVKVNLADIRTGDLILTDTNRDGVVNHVGVYVHPGKMLHTANPKDNICYVDFKPGSYQYERIYDIRRVL
ncbi:Murein DD-endopeptidase MepS/Murein LD-carboxypeptidase precursor [compost metagenome]